MTETQIKLIQILIIECSNRNTEEFDFSVEMW
jgi:hypothetical protein